MLAVRECWTERDAGKAKLLVVDDSRSVLSWMNQALDDMTDLVTLDLIDDPEEAMSLIAARQYDLVIVDYFMPKKSGIELVLATRQLGGYETVPILMITTEKGSEIRISALQAGVNDFLNKPFEPTELRARVSNLLSLRSAQVQLTAQASHLAGAVARATEEIARREEEVIWRLARAIEMRDGGTSIHVSRVAAISQAIARGLGFDAPTCRMIYLAAPLHDVGKIGVRDAVLGKPGKLTPDEMAEMREHVGFGVKILENGSSQLIRIAAAIVGGHHEKWNGSGYPNGLAGEAIPIAARIVAIADVFDALCSERPYKAAWSPQQAYDYIVAASGEHFDPGCVEVFRRLWPEILPIVQSMTDQPTIEAVDDGARRAVTASGMRS